MSLALTIVERVGELEQADPLALPPLDETIDAPALEQAVESVEGPFGIQFTYCGYTVTITGEDEVSICAVTEGELSAPNSLRGEQIPR